jgi:glycosyltransferase involved in cell wall biosynthesis
MAFTYFAMEKWEEVLSLLKVASQFEPPYGQIPLDPTKYTLKPMRYAAFAQFNMGNWNEAEMAATEVLKYEPKNEAMIMIRDKSGVTAKQIEMTDNLIAVKHELEQEKNQDKLKSLALCVPKFMEDQPVFIRLKNQFSENKDNRMVIFCGLSIDAWSPLSVKQGIGGSEEAVINMSRELAKLGWLIDVYCSCDAPGNYDGVEYHNYWEYDKQVKADIFIVWRNHSYIEYAPEKSRAFMWLHDVQRYDDWNDERLARLEKIFPLSKFHRNLLSKFPDNKFYITRNGILPSHFQVEKKKELFACVYASSPDRGLEMLLDVWPEIYKAYPKSVLNVLYGFSKNADEINKANPNWLPWKYKMIEKLKELEKQGVIYRGKVSHLELADIFNNSTYWLYPCFGFAEISCISAMKAQAAGCYPITTDKAALDETVQYGIKVQNEEGKNELNRANYLKAVLDKFKVGVTPAEQKEMSEWAIKTFGWQEVAKEWDRLFRG